MFYYFNEILFLFGGVYIVNRLLYRYYFPKKPKFLPLQVVFTKIALKYFFLIIIAIIT